MILRMKLKMLFRKASCLILCTLLLSLRSQRQASAQAIFDAIGRGDIGAVQRMLQGNTAQTLRQLDHLQNTPLQLAADRGQTEIVRLLIENGATVNTHREDGSTPLQNATWAGWLELMDLLFRHGADLEAVDHNGNTALLLAAYNNKTPSINYLLAYGADIEARNNEGNTPLALAASRGSIDACRLLLAVGADLYSKNKAGNTPLNEAEHAGKRDIVDLFTRYDAELKVQAVRTQRRKDNPLAIRTSYANWTDQTAQTKVVYKNDFSHGTIGSEWTTLPLPGAAQAPLRVSTTPKGNRNFLGDFGSQSVRLTLTNLPPHKEIAVSFDLFILNSWDGSDSNAGPDQWGLSIVDGPTLLSTTFANCCTGIRPDWKLEQYKNVKVQAYPDEYPGGYNAMYTGADEIHTLGYMFRGEHDIDLPMDAVYKMRYTLKHTEGDITLSFAAQGLEPLDNESWGITNLEVSVDSPQPVAVKPPTGKPASPGVSGPKTSTDSSKTTATTSKSATDTSKTTGSATKAATAAPKKTASAPKTVASTPKKTTRATPKKTPKKPTVATTKKKPTTPASTAAGAPLHDKKAPLTP